MRCATGVRRILDTVKSTGPVEDDVAKGEILISMFTRFMADGGAGRIQGFNATLQALVDAKAKLPQNQQGYQREVMILADRCRDRMERILAECENIPGPENALARQALLTFMGDLGGLEATQTGFGAAYSVPLCGTEKPDPGKVYDTFVRGLYDAQGRPESLAPSSITGKNIKDPFKQFKEDLEKARERTTVKDTGGVLSAAVHTIDKKGQRKMVVGPNLIRDGLLGQGPNADEKIFDKFNSYQIDDAKRLLSVGWPQFVVPEALVEDVVEPVTGHISGSFGELAVMILMFYGVQPQAITAEKPFGDAPPEAVQAIASIAAAMLISAGYHSAVEIFQPMSTFCGNSPHLVVGKIATENTRKYVEELDKFANWKQASSR